MNYLEKIEKFRAIINKIIRSWLIFMLLLLFLVIVMKVFLLIFGISVIWYLEVSQYCVINIVYFGAALAFCLNQHVSLSIFIDSISEKTKNLIEFFNLIVITFFSIVLFYSAFVLLFKSKGVTPTLNVPIWIYYFPIFGGSFFLVIYELIRIFEKTSKFLKRK